MPTLKIEKLEKLDSMKKNDMKQSDRQIIPVIKTCAKFILKISKKYMFFDTTIKVIIYLGALFLLSIATDYMTVPQTYFSRKDNIFNQYFVKKTWLWTLLLTIPYLLMTSYIQCKGSFKKILINHAPRILIGAVFSYGWVITFYEIQLIFGKCSDPDYNTKKECRENDEEWGGFDISGHTFVLVYSSLVLIEEARPIINWDGLREQLKNIDEIQTTEDQEGGKKWTLSKWYGIMTPIIKFNFVCMAIIHLLWDIMLLCTILYFHNMGEKLLGGAIGAFTWYFTYQFWYQSLSIPPNVVGVGYLEKENDVKPDAENPGQSSAITETYISDTTDSTTHL